MTQKSAKRGKQPAKAEQPLPAKQPSRDEILAGIAEAPPSTGAALSNAIEWYENQPKAPRTRIAEHEGQALKLEYEFLAVGSSSEVNRALHQLLLTRAFGTRSEDFRNALELQLVNYQIATGGFSETSLNAAVAVLASAQPENELEAMLILQALVANDAAMRAAGKLAGAQTAEGITGLGNLTNKFMRTYTAQMEALAKMRRGGEQVVRHIHVDNRGGQAVIAETVQAGGANARSVEQCHEPDAAASIGTAVFGPHAERH